MKKHPFLLTELIVSLFLSSLILSMLFQFFISFKKQESKVENAKKELMIQERLYQKLYHIFSQLSAAPELGSLSFYTKKTPLSLCFYFDNGVDIDPHFSGIVKGKLFIQGKDFILQTKSIEKKKKKRRESLCSNITKMHMYFFTRAIEEKTIYKKVGKKYSWYKTWPIQNISYPKKFDLTLYGSEGKIHFAFFVANERSSPLEL